MGLPPISWRTFSRSAFIGFAIGVGLFFAFVFTQLMGAAASLGLKITGAG